MLKRIIYLIVFLCLLVIVGTFSFLKGAYVFGGFCAILGIGLIFLLIREYQRNIKKLIFMLNAVEANDFSFHFNEQVDDSKNAKLFNYVLNRIKNMMFVEKQNLIEKERYYEAMLESADTGIVAVDEHGFVLFRNAKALQIVGLPILTHLSQLARIDEDVMRIFMQSEEGLEQKVSFYNERGKVLLSLSCTQVEIQKKSIRILAINNISDEVEAGEVEAWTRLIRVLTHEIMNSIAPIASLSESLSNDYAGTNPDIKEGLKVINRTSKGLISFVDSYRSLTRISKPMKKAVSLQELLDRIFTLVQNDLQREDVKVEIKLSDDSIMLYVDEQQISQVIINIIKNAIQAKAKHIVIKAAIDSKESISIDFINDGVQIALDHREQIFVPFFTTKVKGSGIGLSLSRQIMQMHDGSIQLLRSNEKETAFRLFFK